MNYLDEKAPTWQKPKSSHPWRQYIDRKVEIEIKEEKHQKQVKVFIKELAESWDSIEVITSVSGREGRWKLVELPQAKQAAWLSSFLKRNYGN